VTNALQMAGVRIRPEIQSESHTPPSERSWLVVGRVVELGESTMWSKGDRVLVDVPEAGATEIEAASATCFKVPDGMPGSDALLIPPTAQALRVWRRLRLEIGETAVYSDGDERTPFVALAAGWRGAVPVIRLTSDGSAHDAETIDVSDALPAVERLRSLTANAPGLAAVDLSGRGETIALLLEALPRWARLVLAGPPPEPFTTAFYTDIHRKAVVVGSADLNSMFTNPVDWQIDVRNACRLLMDPKHAAKLRDCVRDRSSVAASTIGHIGESNVRQQPS